MFSTWWYVTWPTQESERAKWIRYLKKEFGRHDFQINLGMSLLTRAIKWDWDGKSKKQGWMRQSPVLLCNCNQCFFCLNGITIGITHHPTKEQKVTVDYKCRTRVKVDKCMSEWVNLELQVAQYCRMCYRKQSSIELTLEVRKGTCRTSKMGCPICKEPICKESWNDGYDKHV